MSDNWMFNPMLIGNAKHGDRDVIRTRFDMPCKRSASLNNAKAAIWDGPTAGYVFPTAPMQMQVVSSSAADAAAGTGVQQIHIHYLDRTYTEQEISVTLNGVTPVLTVPTDILRINAFHAVRLGSAGDAVSNISVQNVGGTVTYGILTAGHNRARHPVFTVPAGKTAYIAKWKVTSASTAAAIVDVELEATAHYGVLYPGVMLMQDIAVGQYLIEDIDLRLPIVLPATADVLVTGISAGAADNATVTANVFGWYE